MPKPRREWLLGALRLVGGSISAGAALVSILSYTTSSHPAVSGIPAHRLALAPSPDSAGAIGDTVQLAALATDERGAAVTGTQPVWTTTDPAVLTVDQAGTVVATGAGSAVVVVRVGELEARRRIMVRQRPSALVVDDTVIRVHESERLNPVARVLDPRGRPIVGLEPAWTSGDPAVAAVDSTGAVLAVSSGETELVATAGGLQAVLRLVVLPVPSSITVLAGEGQRAPAGSRLGSPVTAQVVSRSGRPVAGVPVRFEPMAGGVADPAVDTTDGQGMAQAVWTLADLPGRQRITLGVEGIGAAPILTAEADPVPGNARVVLADAEPAGTVGDTIGSPVVARLTDSLGRALADVPVAWAAADGGSLTALSPRTDSLGEARALWRLGPKAGRQRARVQAGNPRSLPPVTISASARPATAMRVAVADGSGQLGTVGKPLKAPIVIRALDPYGNPVAGVNLVRASGSGAALDGAAVTDSSGTARFRWTLGGEAGAQRLVVRLRDDTASAVVTARAGAGEPSALTLVGPGRWGGMTQLPVTLSLTDSYGNPVAGRVVTLRTGSGSVKPSRVTTDGEGRAQVRWAAAAKVRSPLVASVIGTKVGATLNRPRP